MADQPLIDTLRSIESARPFPAPAGIVPRLPATTRRECPQAWQRCFSALAEPLPRVTFTELLEPQPDIRHARALWRGASELGSRLLARIVGKDALPVGESRLPLPMMRQGYAAIERSANEAPASPKPLASLSRRQLLLLNEKV